MTAPTLDHQIAEVKRELALRKNVYPKFVSAGKMRQAEADICTERMTAALHTLMAVKRLRATMVAHIIRDLGIPGQRSVKCSCSWQSPASSQPDEPISAWLDHVFERSKAAEEATS